MAAVETYEASGKVAWGKAPVGLLLGGGIGVASVVLYAVLTRWNLLGFIPISIAGIHAGEVGMILYWAATLFGVGMGVYLAVNMTHCRNGIVGLAMGLGLGVFFVYIHWMVLGLLMGAGFVLPHQVFGMQQALIEAEWTSFSLLESPGLNWVFWGIEAVGIAGVGAVLGLGSARDPYCESCEKWADDEEALDAPLSAAPETLSALLQEGRFNDLVAFGPAADPNAEFFRYRFTIKKCPSCDRLNVVEVETVTLEYDDDGDVEEKTDKFVDGLMLPLDALTHLRSTLGHAEAAVTPGEDGEQAPLG